jgi:hypothetical protein
MPDEEGNQEIDEAPETSLHAHGSGIEEDGAGAGDDPSEVEHDPND